VAHSFKNIIVDMKLIKKKEQNNVTTSVLFSERPTMRSGFLSVIGMVPKRRFGRYLQGNDFEDLQRDARLVANDMNAVLKRLNYGK
jgi:hypothetical protein